MKNRFQEGSIRVTQPRTRVGLPGTRELPLPESSETVISGATGAAGRQEQPLATAMATNTTHESGPARDERFPGGRIARCLADVADEPSTAPSKGFADC